jgi:peptidoglycan/LPS O-acetylase OafA/YrhL
LTTLDSRNTEPGEKPAIPRIRLEYLEGLRGLAALYVVLHHAYMELHYRQALPGHESGLPQAFFKALKFLDFGHYAVDIFIVLSGYCLMLPIVTSAGSALRGGIMGYFQRRARRILPPYYAVLVISLLAVPLIRYAQMRMGAVDAMTMAGYTPFVVTAHLLLLHNLSPNLSLFTNPPLWSVATEWQIYFFFPFFLWLWRRFGLAAPVLAGFALGLAPHYLLHGMLDSAYPWYLGLFALGMAGASINFSDQPSVSGLRNRAPWGFAAGALWLGLGLFGIVKSGWYADHRWLADPVFGLATMCLLVFGTEQLRSGVRLHVTSVVRLFDSRFSRRLGAFSYSLYLIHFPLIILGDALLLFLRVSAPLRVAGLFGIVVPLTVLIAYGFYLAFERPFIASRASKTGPAVIRQ